MSIFVLRRILTLVATLIGASVIIFLVLDALPGNAAQMLMGADASPDAVRALTIKLGLDQPLLHRYLLWIHGMVVGDLGNSYVYGTPVAELIAERMALTIPLAIMSMLITVVLALTAGIYAAANHNKIGDVGMMSLTQVGIALPNFWFAILLILLFAVKLPWFQVVGGTSLKGLVLPAVTLALGSAGFNARFVRSSIVHAQVQKHVITARAKGITRVQVFLRHVLRNALLPVLTVAGLQVGQLLSGTVIVETVFSRPGIGRLLVQAILAKDYLTVQAVVLIIAMLYALTNFAVDLLYPVLDPRLAKR